MNTIYTAEVWISFKIASLVDRFKVSVPGLDISICHNDDDRYVLAGGASAWTADRDEEARGRKVLGLLGLDQSGEKVFDTLDDLEQTVDDALSLAPKARSR